MLKHIAPLLVLPLLVSGCGGGSKGDSGEAAAKASYLKQAEAICATANSAQKALVTPSSADGLAPYVAGVVNIADTATTALGKLTPPAKDKAALESKVLAPLREQLVKGHAYALQVAAAAKAKDNAALVKLLGDPPNKTVADLGFMRSYGFKECVSAADTSG